MLTLAANGRLPPASVSLTVWEVGNNRSIRIQMEHTIMLPKATYIHVPVQENLGLH